jgi:hypothetical protein
LNFIKSLFISIAGQIDINSFGGKGSLMAIHNDFTDIFFYFLGSAFNFTGKSKLISQSVFQFIKLSLLQWVDCAIKLNILN